MAEVWADVRFWPFSFAELANSIGQRLTEHLTWSWSACARPGVQLGQQQTTDLALVRGWQTRGLIPNVGKAVVVKTSHTENLMQKMLGPAVAHFIFDADPERSPPLP
jgi:hypothetical protein